MRLCVCVAFLCFSVRCRVTGMLATASLGTGWLLTAVVEGYRRKPAGFRPVADTAGERHPQLTRVLAFSGMSTLHVGMPSHICTSVAAPCSHLLAGSQGAQAARVRCSGAH